jgi:riboflavin kinase
MDLLSLLTLAKRGCCKGSVEISSHALGRDLGTSQQTASRKLRELEKEGYIYREVHPRGQRIRLTTKGVEALRMLHQELSEVFAAFEPHVYYVTGEVFSGLGEGRYYMQIQGYKEQFKSKLGFTPFPGTLNLRLKTDEDIKLKQKLQEHRGILIEGFEDENRTFGSAKCFPAEIEGTEGAVVIPARSHYSLDTLEFIAPVKIREKAGLKDGDIVTVKVRVW